MGIAFRGSESLERIRFCKYVIIDKEKKKKKNDETFDNFDDVRVKK